MTGPLLRLTIEGVGLIERADIAFGAGFTAFTGETGSGKTMLLGALDAALGGRVERDLVHGERARVVLELDGSRLRERLAGYGIALAPDDDVVIVREIAAAGRSQARVNGTAVSATQLREIGALVVDSVGQGEAQRLLDPAFARDLLDRAGGEEALALRAAVREAHEARRLVARERDLVRASGERAASDRAFAEFARAEIDEAGVTDDDEDERLRERRDVLADAERIAGALARARAALEDDGAAVDGLGLAARSLANLARYGEPFAGLAATADALQADAGALATALARAADDVEHDPHELAAVADRLAALDALKRKYGGSLAAVRAARDGFAGTVDADAQREGRLAALEREHAALDAAFAHAVAALRERRAAAAAGCAERVTAELRALAMPAARFAVALESLAEPGPHGADRVEFRFAANPGEPERPLARVASGGERSRVLLALVVALANSDEGRAFVFDEIDAGIGGAAAVAAGTRLARLAAFAQVVCVTHLAQIAARAETHYALRKRDDGEATTIEVVPLADSGSRLAEIARMLAGEVSPISLEHAAALVAGSQTAFA